MTVTPIPQLLTELKMTQEDQQAPNCSLYSWWSASWRGFVAEFLATLTLILFGCMSCIPMLGVNMAITAPFSFGIVVLFNIQTFGHISGAYMNPAVTLASVIWGSTSIGVGIIYVIVECAGAILGYGILLKLSPLDLAEGNICVTAPHESLTDLQSLGVETALTIALILINCGVWDSVNASKQDSIPIKFGLTIVGLSLLGGPLTGASMNPARSLGPAVWTGHWTHQWIYWVGPCMGSFMAVVFYKNVFLMKPEINYTSKTNGV